MLTASLHTQCLKLEWFADDLRVGDAQLYLKLKKHSKLVSCRQFSIEYMRCIVQKHARVNALKQKYTGQGHSIWEFFTRNVRHFRVLFTGNIPTKSYVLTSHRYLTYCTMCLVLLKFFTHLYYHNIHTTILTATL